ncbi:hypothetical protein ZIOFF_013086 [Zingiber officinale]|uniref:Uncharacterized protein n=1 Tax=Zingiber officinale TaxID=94328 RepID=A0A8J5LKM6_ZINOF|nr:hypothetical protein ZIOFF_013086 [Zingiber officinale]
MRLWALPRGFFFLSCFATFGVCPRTFPARAKEPCTLPDADQNEDDELDTNTKLYQQREISITNPCRRVANEGRRRKRAVCSLSEGRLGFFEELIARLKGGDSISILGLDFRKANYLASRGVIAILGTRFNIEELRQQRWILRPSTGQSLVAPTRVLSRTLLDGSVSMEFQGYTPMSENTRESNVVREDQDDMDVTSPDGEILAMMTEELQTTLYVMKLDQNAILLERNL